MSTFLSSPNGSFMKIGSTFLAVPEIPPAPTVYDYFTFKAGPGSYTIKADPVNWVEKKWTNSYLYDLTDNTQTSLKAPDGDAFYMSYGNGHTYMAEWTEEAIISTRDASTSSKSYWNQFSVFYGGEQFTGIVELYSIDFWHKPKWNNTKFPDVTIIPQIAANIHRGDVLTDCSNLFKNAPITNSIEAFILAMREACPNLTTTTGCFAGCTSAPDYAYCLEHYPEWF